MRIKLLATFFIIERARRQLDARKSYSATIWCRQPPLVTPSKDYFSLFSLLSLQITWDLCWVELFLCSFKSLEEATLSSRGGLSGSFKLPSTFFSYQVCPESSWLVYRIRASYSKESSQAETASSRLSVSGWHLLSVTWHMTPSVDNQPHLTPHLSPSSLFLCVSLLARLLLLSHWAGRPSNQFINCRPTDEPIEKTHCSFEAISLWKLIANWLNKLPATCIESVEMNKIASATLSLLWSDHLISNSSFLSVRPCRSVLV